MILSKNNLQEFNMGFAVSGYPVVTNDLQPARFVAQQYSFDRGFALVFEIDGKERRFDGNGRHKKVGSSLKLHIYKPSFLERIKWEMKLRPNPFK